MKPNCDRVAYLRAIGKREQAREMVQEHQEHLLEARKRDRQNARRVRKH